MGTSGSRHVVLDAGALIAIERGNRRLMRVLELADEVHVPAGALAQVWRDPSRQALLARFVAAEETSVHALTGERAKAAGLICGRSGTVDVIDASVVLLAREADAVILTSDPDDLSRLAPDLRIAAV